MSIGSIRTASATLLGSIYLVLAGFMRFFSTGDYFALMIPAAALISYFAVKDRLLPTLFSFSSAIYLASPEPISMLVAMGFAGFYPFMASETVKTGKEVAVGNVLGPASRRALLYVASFIPALFIRIEALPVLMTMVVAVLAVSLKEYALLRSVHVKLHRGLYRLTLGDVLMLSLSVDAPRHIYCTVFRDGEKVFSSPLKQKVVKIPYYGRRLGAFNVNIEVNLVDLRGFSSRWVGPFTAKVRVLAKTMISLRLAESLLESVRDYIGAPRVILMRRGPAAFPTGFERAAGVAGSGAGSGRGGVGGGGGRGGIIRGWLRALGLFRGLIPERSPRRRRGDYMGAREYYPGDSIRDVHWKKSLSKGVLYVKEYGGRSPAGGGGPILFIVDLTCSNPIELDRVAFASHVAILRHATSHPLSEAILYIILPSGKEYFMRGRSLEVFKAFQTLFKIEDVFVRYDYESPGRSLPGELIRELYNVAEDVEVVGYLVTVARSFAQSFIGELLSLDVKPPMTFTLIHGRPTAFKYSILRLEMVSAGYAYAPPEKASMREIAKLVEELVSSILD